MLVTIIGVQALVTLSDLGSSLGFRTKVTALGLLVGQEPRQRQHSVYSKDFLEVFFRLGILKKAAVG